MAKSTVYNILLILLVLTGFMNIHSTKAQSLSNQGVKHIVFESDTLYIDSLSIVPGSFQIMELDTNDYVLYESKALLILKNKS